jgi:hypothetical protein
MLLTRRARDRRLAPLVATLALTGCASSSSPAPGPPAPAAGPGTAPNARAPERSRADSAERIAVDAASTPVSSATRWRFARSAGAQVTDVRVEADVERAAPDGRAETERVETSAIVSLLLARGAAGEITVSGRVDSLTVRAGARVRGSAPSTAGGGVRLRGALDARGTARLELESVAGVDARCATPGRAESIVALALAHEGLPRVPAALAVGTRWRDTSTVAGCAGPVPLRVQTAATYEVLGAPDAAAWQSVASLSAGLEAASVVRVRRQTVSTLRGQGFAASRFASVAGSGTGDGVLLLDAASGRLLSLDESAQSTFALTLVGEAPQRFTQRVRTRVAARP